MADTPLSPELVAAIAGFGVTTTGVDISRAIQGQAEAPFGVAGPPPNESAPQRFIIAEPSQLPSLEGVTLLGRGSQVVKFGGAVLTLPPLSGGASWVGTIVKRDDGRFTEEFGDNEALFNEGQHGLLIVTLRGPTFLRPIIQEVAEHVLHLAESFRIRGVQTWDKVQVVTDSVGREARLFIPFTKGQAPLALIAGAIAGSILILALVAGWKLMRLTPNQAVEAIGSAGSAAVAPVRDVTQGIKAVGEGIGEGTKSLLDKAGLALIIAAAVVAIMFILSKKAG